ncbi:MAG: 2-phospho-L-lactate guanylyltransferase [Proteobacteria bacterium]|nr:2-phospho-L-lactate guanylyltransferase [Pseudomonadota bacterium]
MTRDATWAATWAVVPVTTLDAAKQRLAGALDPAARRGLSLAMLADVLDALDATAGLDGAAVVSRDADVMELARRRGLRVIPETGAGLNAAVAQAANVLSAEGCARLLVMPADLPLAGPEEIAQVLAALPEAPGLTLVPDRHGVGTNGFLCSPPDAVAPCFGADSFARHLFGPRMCITGLIEQKDLSGLKVHALAQASIVPALHQTIFAPYFVAGAIYSGVALVITLLVPLRRVFRVERYITTDHFENLAKLLLFTGMIVGYAYVVEYFMAWYSGNAFERAAFWNRAFGDYWWASWTMIICNGFLPFLLWFKKIRRSIPALLVLSLFVNLGMWFERFVIIVVSLSFEYEPYAMGHYTPSWVEWAILAGSFGWFFMWFLLFAKNFPTVSITEVKEVIPMPRKRAV